MEDETTAYKEELLRLVAEKNEIFSKIYRKRDGPEINNACKLICIIFLS